MLKGQKPIDFKRAVFVTENAYYKGTLNYQTFCNSISATGQQLKALIKQRGLESLKHQVIGQYSLTRQTVYL